MNTNDTLVKIKTALQLSSSTVIKIYDLVGYSMTQEHLDHILDRSRLCSYEELGQFLDGLIVLKRGPSPTQSDESQVVELTNNLILKKLRIALQLKEPETEIIFNLGEVALGKQQLSSLFRKEDHKNFKVCSDELLVAFLDGLEEFYYVDNQPQ